MFNFFDYFMLMICFIIGFLYIIWFIETLNMFSIVNIIIYGILSFFFIFVFISIVFNDVNEKKYSKYKYSLN